MELAVSQNVKVTMKISTSGIESSRFNRRVQRIIFTCSFYNNYREDLKYYGDKNHVSQGLRCRSSAVRNIIANVYKLCIESLPI